MAAGLIRVEWLKMRKYKAFWLILILTALSYPGVTLIMYSSYQEMINQPTQASQLAKIALGNPFTFPEVWHTVAFLSSLFVFVPAVVVIMLVSNEYSFKTHRQNIIDGWSRNQFIGSKLIDVLLITILITILLFAACLVTGILAQERLIWNTWDNVYFVGLFALQTFSQLTIAFFIGFLVKKAFLALGIFTFYFLVLENVIGALLKYKLHINAWFLPLEISDRMIPLPAVTRNFNKDTYDIAMSNINFHILMTCLLTTLLWAICFWINKRKDLR